MIPTHQQLVEAAVTAASQAHCPYSKFHVGAALLAEDGTIFAGANVENASYGLTICAERSAFCAAVTSGARTFRAIAIVASGDEPPPPCGACRQVMAEFCSPDMPVLLATIDNPAAIQNLTLGELLPHTFTLK